MASENINITFLLNQLQQGSEAAFSKIYDHFSPQLYQSILYLVKDQSIAEEILQDLFMHVWNRRSSIDPENTFWPYLYKVAKWLIQTHFKKVAKDKRLLEQLIISAVEHVINAEDLMIQAEGRLLLAKAIENLPPKRKEVFKLCKIEGKSHKEAADILGISTDTISNQIKAANKSLKDFFLHNSDLAVVIITSTITYMVLNQFQTAV